MTSRPRQSTRTRTAPTLTLPPPPSVSTTDAATTASVAADDALVAAPIPLPTTTATTRTRTSTTRSVAPISLSDLASLTPGQTFTPVTTSVTTPTTTTTVSPNRRAAATLTLPSTTATQSQEPQITAVSALASVMVDGTAVFNGGHIDSLLLLRYNDGAPIVYVSTESQDDGGRVQYPWAQSSDFAVNSTERLRLQQQYQLMFIYEIVGLAITIGADKTLQYLQSRVWYSPAEILANSPKLQKAREKARLEAEIYTARVITVPGAFTCRKCGSKETESAQKQVRSADEPMTTFIRCSNCGNRWKE